MKKKPTSQSRKAKHVVAPPAGLAVAFRLIDFDGRSGFPSVEEIFPHATRVIDDSATDLSVSKEIEGLARTAYTGEHGQDAASNPAFTGAAGFSLGFATAWLLFTSINGGAR